MPEQINNEQIEKREATSSGLLLSVEPLEASASEGAREAGDHDTDTSRDSTDGGESDTDSGDDSDSDDGDDSDGSDSDATDADDSDESGDADGTDDASDADGTDTR